MTTTIHRFAPVGLLILACAVSLPAQEKRPMNPEDVLALAVPGSVRISPDGQRVVYALSRSDVMKNENRSEIWISDSRQGPPRRFTLGKNDRSPEWSPDGRFVGFLSSRAEGGDDTTQVYVIPVDGGEADRLTSSKTSVTTFAWAPDSSRIAFLSPTPLTEEQEARRKRKDDAEVIDQNHRWSHLAVIDVTTRRTTSVVPGSMTISDLDWSPDSKSIAFTARPTPKADDGSISDIYIVSADGKGSPRRLHENAGPDSNPKWSPDGKVIAFTSRPTTGTIGIEHLHVVSADGTGARRLTQDFDSEVRNVVWSKDGTSLLFQSGARTNSHIYSVSTSGGAVRQITTQDGTISDFSVSPAGRLAFVRSDLLNPPEVFAAALGSADPVRLTDHNSFTKKLALGKTEITKWKSTDGMEIEGILVYPPDYTPGKRYPVLANIHGGPSGVWTQSFPSNWSNFAHVWAGKGWVVFMPNVRGSSSYGEKFLTSNIRDWGGGDYRDLQSGLDELVKRGIADPDRMGQTGWSYGGYMTAWTLTQTNRFKAAMVGAGLTNMFSMYSTNDLQRTLEGYFGDTPFNDSEAYARASAMTHIKNARTPTLIMHGGSDTRVPPSQAQELYMGLRKNNVPVEMVVFPREPHGLGEPEHRLDKMNREYAWFSKHVLGSEDRFKSTDDRTQVLDIVRRTFDYLAARDAESMKRLFWPEAWVAADRPNAQGERLQSVQRAEEFFRSVANGTPRDIPIREELTGEPEVRIDDNIATLWSKYVFTRGADYVADGTDAFHLVRRDGEWKILSLIYTHNPRR